MQWLLHGNLAPAVGEALVRHGHRVHALEELGLGPEAPFGEVFEAVARKQWDILTNDQGLANAPFEQGISFPRTVVFLQLAGGEVEQDDAIDRLFDRYKRLSPRRMYTVTETRVKVRQLPR